MNYEGRSFRSVENTDAGDVGDQTLFHYHQNGDVVWATYAGGAVQFGTLVATVAGDGSLAMRYHHVATDGSLKSGKCVSRPEVLADGRLRLHETWEWTSGAAGAGCSIVEEIQSP